MRVTPAPVRIPPGAPPSTVLPLPLTHPGDRRARVIAGDVHATLPPPGSHTLPPPIRQPSVSVRSSADVARAMRHLADDVRESLVALYLNAANQVIGVDRISTGGLSSTTVEPAEIIRTALLPAVEPPFSAITIRPGRSRRPRTITRSRSGSPTRPPCFTSCCWIMSSSAPTTRITVSATPSASRRPGGPGPGPRPLPPHTWSRGSRPTARPAPWSSGSSSAPRTAAPPGDPAPAGGGR